MLKPPGCRSRAALIRPERTWRGRAVEAMLWRPDYRDRVAESEPCGRPCRERVSWRANFGESKPRGDRNSWGADFGEGSFCRAIERVSCCATLLLGYLLHTVFNCKFIGPQHDTLLSISPKNNGNNFHILQSNKYI